MSPRNKFRVFVISTNCGYLLYALLILLLYDEQFDVAYEKLPAGILEEYFSNTTFTIIFFTTFFGLWLSSVVGLFLFRNWGRILTVSGLIIGLPLMTLFGPSIVAGWESALTYLLDTCFGITLAVMYLQPISSEFNKPCKHE